MYCWFLWYWEERRRIRIYCIYLAYMVLVGEEEIKIYLSTFIYCMLLEREEKNNNIFVGIYVTGRLIWYW